MSVSRPSSLSTSHKLWEHIKKWGRNAPVYIVVHFTGGFSDNLWGMTSIYKSYLEHGSNAHYLVGSSAIWEMVNPKTHYCTYSCGSPVGKKNMCRVDGWGPATYRGPLSMSLAGVVGHSNSINVEICSCKSGPRSCDPMSPGWYFSDSTYLRAVQLCAWLCDEHGIKVSNIVMHNQVTGKLCPAMWCNAPGAESGLGQFRRDVSLLLNDLQEDTPVSPSPEPAGGTINVAMGTLYYSRPSEDSAIVDQATSDTDEAYSVEQNNFYYTQHGWVNVG